MAANRPFPNGRAENGTLHQTYLWWVWLIHVSKFSCQESQDTHLNVSLIIIVISARQSEKLQYKPGLPYLPNWLDTDPRMASVMSSPFFFFFFLSFIIPRNEVMARLAVLSTHCVCWSISGKQIHVLRARSFCHVLITSDNLFLAYTQAINLDVGPKTCSNCLLLLTFLVCLQGSAFQPQQCKDLPPKKVFWIQSYLNLLKYPCPFSI